ncbi:IS1595 family transposase [Methylobacterium sp. J-030]|uniref:IS1595 family transposase n=1 Tax=Methylobacterium sp. J-030 TaxID=2836627 RepID=UPI001FBB3AB0|nr:IS1595 family transposase [Methylobacterium sp. J-030]MCJ2069348.1 IS1595 family transposase [Methylobacterium sp. J-030]
MSVLSQPHFHDEVAAVARLEAIVWPNGPVCPHCGNADPKRVYSIKGKTARPGLRTCAECRKQFTVKVGTVFEDSKVPLHKWFQAAHLLASSKKGFSAHQLHCVLEVTYRTAWFMMHRLREAMREGSLAPMGGVDGMPGASGTVEADETFIGREPGAPKKRAYHHKMKVLSLLDRESGQVRSVVVDDIKPETIRPIIEANIVKEASLYTDESSIYTKVGATFADHQMTAHGAKEYVRGIVHTNTIEGYFSVFKRGMKGVYQHCGKQHLHRYLAEFDFRYNHRIALGIHDPERTERALRGIVGKRLTYRDSLWR